jgi:uncharacterized membrane protein (UPF0127 family)
LIDRVIRNPQPLTTERVVKGGSAIRNPRLSAVAALLATLGPFLSAGCGPNEPNRLEAMPQDTVTINDRAFKVWLADESEEQTRGLMFVTAEEMAPLPNGTERGMWFLFPTDRSTGFWMRNTIIPLDIAYVRSDGVIVTTHTMVPLDESIYRPSEPYRYALEVNANVFARDGIKKGDRVQIPQALLKRGQ